ncbi:DMT family transporter [Phycicoccus sp. BSK3Z-2]|uniref:DMT family transporter n=2 Tax=Phycicoccus avicenniae TaxID=2828860 RepID=A0A941D8R7_9MICO|nr:DMT family transporter [Phycicoccus avicenniae]
MLGVGALVAVQSQINGTLAGRLGEGLRSGALAAVISFGSGLVVLAVVAALRPGVRRGFFAVPRLVRDGRLRWWQLVGGAAGALLVASQSITVGTIGVALFTVAVVAGQTSTAALVDHLGLGPSGRQAVTRGRLVGAVVTLVAVVVSVAGRLGGSGGIGLAVALLALLPLVAGAGTSFQQAVNGRVSHETGPIAAALNNFTVGTTVLVLLLLAALLLPGRIDGLPGTWWLYLGGLVGVLFITAAAALVKVHGVLVLGLCTIAGQVVSSVLIDAALGEHLGVGTLVGAALALVGVGIGFLTTRTRQERPEPADASALR